MKLKIEHLQKRFDTKDVLKDVTFTFEPGKIYGLLGRNGAGKTTLFNCLNQDISVDISHILGNLITVIFNYQILRKPLKILSL